MVSIKKCIYAAVFIILLTFFAAYIHTVKDDAASPENAEYDLTLMAVFSKEYGI